MGERMHHTWNRTNLKFYSGFSDIQDIKESLIYQDEQSLFEMYFLPPSSLMLMSTMVLCGENNPPVLRPWPFPRPRIKTNSPIILRRISTPRFPVIHSTSSSSFKPPLPSSIPPSPTLSSSAPHPQHHLLFPVLLSPRTLFRTLDIFSLHFCVYPS